MIDDNFIEGFEKTANMRATLRSLSRQAAKAQNSAKQAVQSSGVTKQPVAGDAFKGYSNRAKEQAKQMHSKEKFKNALGF
jgi:hypothetical protein